MGGPTDYPNTAWNRRVQGSLARWVGNVWLPMVERLTAPQEALVLTVHDSVLLDLREDEADEIVAQIKAMTAESWLEHFGIPGSCDESGFEK
jgi:DNA polymerase I-like protein with 3'-5' exonuclease and polymerase domains